MNNFLYKKTFELDTDYNLIINFPKPKSLMHPYDPILIVLHHNNSNYVLYTKDCRDGLRCLKNGLKEALEGKLEKHPALTEDLGYIWSEILSENLPEDPFYLINNQKHWLGLKYLIWSVPVRFNPNNTTTTWIYTQEDNIIFLVTPEYAWHFESPKEHDQFISYDQFIKNYKPIAKIIIPHKKANEIISWTINMLQTMQDVGSTLKSPPLNE